MTRLVTIGDETTHVVGDAKCPECLHAASGEEDKAGTEWPATRCDRCGRTEDELD